MKSLFVEEKYKMHVKEIERPVPEKGKAIVKIHMSGVCGTDVHSYSGNNANTVYPLVIGHEAVGTIIQIEEENEQGLKAGDRVVMEPYIGCGKCYACIQGRYNACIDLKTRGIHFDGMMTEEISHPVEKIYKIPEQITDRQACMIEPFTIGIQATRRVRLKKGEYGVIIGAGAIGLVCAMVVKAYGGIPILLDPVEGRLEKAREMGFQYTFNNIKGNLETYLAEITSGTMPSIIYECSGAKPILENIHNLISVCGRIILIGWPHVPYSHIDTSHITRKELDVIGSRCSCNCFPEAIELIKSSQVDADIFISHIIEMKEAAEVFEDMIADPGKYMKVIIKCQQ